MQRVAAVNNLPLQMSTSESGLDIHKWKAVMAYDNTWTGKIIVQLRGIATCIQFTPRTGHRSAAPCNRYRGGVRARGSTTISNAVVLTVRSTQSSNRIQQLLDHASFTLPFCMSPPHQLCVGADSYHDYLSRHPLLHDNVHLTNNQRSQLHLTRQRQSNTFNSI